MKKVLVSCCLLGLPTRYDATDNRSEALIDLIKQEGITPIPVCPEQLAGLPTPRSKCWFREGNGEEALKTAKGLKNEEGQDVTRLFIAGAEQTLKIATMTGCSMAILQQRSPSCGTRSIYLNEELVPGMGVTAALLKQHGIQVFSDDDLPDENYLKSLHQ